MAHPLPPDLQDFHIGLRTVWLGRHLVYYPRTSSTNDDARRLAETGAPEGTLVLADEQTAGRGRMGRRWVAPAGSSLLMSLLLRPHLPPAQLPRLTMACGLAMSEAVEEISGVRPSLKWPNDLLVGPKKLAGILTEMAMAGEQADFVIVGIGVNVNGRPAAGLQTANDLLTADPSLAHLAARATSLEVEAGRPISRLTLLWQFLERLEHRYKQVRAGQSPYREWASRLSTLGQMIHVTTAGQTWAGVAVGVDEDGALILRLPDGMEKRILAGDVTLR